MSFYDCRKYVRDELMLIYVGMFFWNDEVMK
jgi:hypothetical protein